MVTPRQDLATIDAQLAQEAADVSKTIAQPESRKITQDRDGNLIAPGGLNLGNEINVCIVDYCSANDYYTAAYDPNNPAPPVCFARGRELAEMYPEDISPEPQNQQCGIPGKTGCCPHNEWGSAGKGKACKNTRNLAVVLIDELDLEHQEPDLYLIQVPPTGLASCDAALLAAARMYNGVMKAIIPIRTISKGAYTTLQFGSPEPNPHYADLFQYRDLAEKMIGRLPDLTNYRPTKTAQQARPSAIKR